MTVDEASMEVVVPDELPDQERTSLRFRLSAATSDLTAFVDSWRAEIDKGTGTPKMVVDDPPEDSKTAGQPLIDPTESGSRDQARSAAIKDIAAIKAGDLLDAQATTAASLLSTQADVASALLAHQAQILNDSVTGLKDAVLNLERRTVLTEERASMSEERANLTDRRANRQRSLAGPIVVVVVLLSVLGLLFARQLYALNQLKVQQAEICSLNLSLHRPGLNCR